jgi:hypothetical protein
MLAVGGQQGRAMTPEPLQDAIETLLAELVAQQEGRMLGLARRRQAGQDASEIHYEDGVLAGLQAALAAVQARRRPRG